MLEDRGSGNEIFCGENVTMAGHLTGNNNRVTIGNSLYPSTLQITISGDDNVIEIGSPIQIHGLTIRIGNHVPAHRCRLTIGKEFGIGPRCLMLLQNSGSQVSIGDRCMFSYDIILRNGESPHLIFDRKTKRYIDHAGHIIIGDHVWIGEGVYLNKRTAIADECIAAARSVITKPFSETHCLLAGNPAKVVKSDVEWVRNKDFLRGTPYEESYQEYLDGVEPLHFE